MKPTSLIFLMATLAGIAACGPSTPDITTALIDQHQQTLDAQTQRFAETLKAVEINEQALQVPFSGQPSMEGAGSGSAMPAEQAETKNPLEGLSDEDVLAFKTGFHEAQDNLTAVRASLDEVMNGYTEIKHMLDQARQELDNGTPSDEMTAKFPTIPGRFTELSAKMDQVDASFGEVQKKVIAFLMARPTTQNGASWLMANSPRI